MADARRLIESAFVPDVAKELAAQLTAGIGNGPRLTELGVPARVAAEIAAQIAGPRDARRLQELGVPTQAAAEFVAQAGGSTPTPTPTPTVADPAQFTFTGAYRPAISQVGSGSASKFTSDYSEATRKARITPAQTIYVRKSGSVNNDGLSLANAIPSLRLAIARANTIGTATEINFEAALPSAAPIIYRNSDTAVRSGQPDNNTTWGQGWRGTDALVDIIFTPSVAGGVAYSAMDFVNPSYSATADPNIYVATVDSLCGFAVLDFANRDRNNSPRSMASVFVTPANPAAPWPEINALWTQYSAVVDVTGEAAYATGVSWRDTTNGKIYVRTFNNRAPDSSLLHTASSGTNGAGQVLAPTAARKLYIEGLRFVSGGTTMGAFGVRGANGFRPQVDFVRCGFVAGYGPGALSVYGDTTADGADVILYRCYAYGGLKDNFNYHQRTTFAEIDCNSEWAGWDSGLANNASTAHEDCEGYRIASAGYGFYLQAQDRSIHDVHVSKSLGYGITVSTRRGADAAEQSAAIVCGHPSAEGVTQMWIRAVTVVNGAGGAPQYRTVCYAPVAPAVLRYADMAFVPTATPGTGTVTSYTP